MRKYIPIMFAILIGLLFGNMLFSSYRDVSVMTSDGNIYILQYGAYTDKLVYEENIKGLDNYYMVEENDIYYVYLGVTTNYFNALNIKKAYQNKKIYLYIKSIYLGNNDAIKKIKILDDKLKDLVDDNEIIAYSHELLNIYKKGV